MSIIEKNEKKYVRLQEYQVPKGHFQIKLPQIFDGFTDQLVVQCDIQVVKNTFIDDSK